MTYLYTGKTETQFSANFWATVDPYHLPGTTVETNSHANSAGEAQVTDQKWVGGAQVAKAYGAAGMSMHSWSTSLFGKKSWFMFDNEIVCLGAGITCSGPKREVHTTAENPPARHDDHEQFCREWPGHHAHRGLEFKSAKCIALVDRAGRRGRILFPGRLFQRNLQAVIPRRKHGDVAGD